LADGPIVIAHRGASGYLPEHTLAAKAMALSMGADYLEQDVVLSKDGVPVVLHDIHLELVTNVAKVYPDRHRDDGRYYAIDFTLAELKRLQINERTKVNGAVVFEARFPAGSSALQLNTLEEEIVFVQGLNRSTGKQIGIYPEIKQPAWHQQQGQDISAIVLEMLHKYGYRQKSDPCWLQCFELATVKRIRQELGWQGRLVQLIGNGAHAASDSDYAAMLTESGMQELSNLVDAIGPEISLVVKGDDPDSRHITEVVHMAHRHGIQVHPFTVRSDALPVTVQTMDELHQALFIEAGVDGVFTDFPDQTADFIAENKIWVTRLHPLEPMPLWPATPPGSITASGPERDTSTNDSAKVAGKPVIRLGNVSAPTLTVYPAPAEIYTGTTVVVCPGGGYHILAWDLEGTEVCQWLNSIGVNAALLKYRVPRAQKDQVPIEPLQDVQRAISLLRSRAVELAIAENRIGVLGFSAGGNLAARAATQAMKRAYPKLDEVDSVSCRPDYAVLIYPAYLFDKKSPNLVGDDLIIDGQTPPMFLTMAIDDPVDSENVLRMATALKQAKVPCELHLFPSGGHGYGLRPGKHAAYRWPQLAASWLRAQGMLESP
jgi:glycerophosphoryl diester phosphodiesterase